MISAGLPGFRESAALSDRDRILGLRPGHTASSLTEHQARSGTMTNGSSQSAGQLATAGGAVVTRSGIVQARCGRQRSGTQPTACPAWRLSRPGMRRWRPCYACGSDQVPAPVEAASAEVAAAVAHAMEGRA
jgi:hypothetical protein